MILAHIGVAICIIGVGFTSTYSVQQDIRMEPGDSVEVAGYQFKFISVSPYEGPNYIADQAKIVITKNKSVVTTLYPQKRRYLASGQTMTEASISSSIFRDLYVALGEPLKGNAWGIRVYVKPFVSWVWLGGLFIAIGALMASLDKRYRRRAS